MEVKSATQESVFYSYSAVKFHEVTRNPLEGEPTPVETALQFGCFPHILSKVWLERSPESTFPWMGVKWAEDGPGLEAPGQVDRATPGGDPLASTP